MKQNPFENLKGKLSMKMKNLNEIISQNDINETLPKPLVRNMNMIVSLPRQINREIDGFSEGIIEKYNEIKRDFKGENFKQKLSDHETKYLSETLANLKILPKEERAKKIQDIKETLAWFRIKFGYAEKKIIKDLYASPPQSKEDVFKRAQNHLKNLPISLELYAAIMHVTDAYFERSQKVRTMKENMTDEELFSAVAGKQPIGPIEIKEAPLSIYIRAHDLKDYTDLYTPKLDDKEETSEELKERMKEAHKSGGFKNHTTTADNAQGRLFLGSKRSVYNHEVQHTLYELYEDLRLELREVWDDNLFDEEARSLWERNFQTKITHDSMNKGFAGAQRILEALYERRLPYILDRGKNEILAYTLDGDNHIEDIRETLTARDGLYNYLEIHKDFLQRIPYVTYYNINIPADIRADIKLTGDWEIDYEQEYQYKKGQAEQIGEYFENFKETLSLKVYVYKYKKILNEGLDCVQDMKDAGFAKETIVRILNHEPINRWPKLTKRLLAK